MVLFFAFELERSKQESFTLSTWVKLDELSNSNYKSIATVGSWDDQRINLYPFNGHLQFTASSSDWSTGVQSQWLPFLHTPDNRFHHIVTVKDNATHSASIYVDGKLVDRIGRLMGRPAAEPLSSRGARTLLRFQNQL